LALGGRYAALYKESRG